MAFSKFQMFQVNMAKGSVCGKTLFLACTQHHLHPYTLGKVDITWGITPFILII